MSCLCLAHSIKSYFMLACLLPLLVEIVSYLKECLWLTDVVRHRSIGHVPVLICHLPWAIAAGSPEASLGERGRSSLDSFCIGRNVMLRVQLQFNFFSSVVFFNDFNYSDEIKYFIMYIDWLTDSAIVEAAFGMDHDPAWGTAGLGGQGFVQVEREQVCPARRGKASVVVSSCTCDQLHPAPRLARRVPSPPLLPVDAL